MFPLLCGSLRLSVASVFSDGTATIAITGPGCGADLLVDPAPDSESSALETYADLLSSLDTAAHLHAEYDTDADRFIFRRENGSVHPGTRYA